MNVFKEDVKMSDQHVYGPEPVPHGVWYFIYTLVGVLGLLIAAWIVSML